jgi:hypothetical protein
MWACLADVQAAYDSVGPDSKSLTYRAAGLPEDFINFAHQADQQATTSILVPNLGTAAPSPHIKGSAKETPCQS